MKDRPSDTECNICRMGMVGELLNFTIDSFPLHFGRKVFGSHGRETRLNVDILRFLELYKLGKLKLKEQSTHRFDLEDINEAIDVVRTGEAGRWVISVA